MCSSPKNVHNSAISTIQRIPLTLFETNRPVPSKLFKYFPLVLLASSCTITLPEFQTAESLAPRENEIAVGGFSGRGLNASTGAAAVYNRGLSSQIDLTTTTSISRLNIEQNNLRISAVIGPKWSTPNQKWAISAPLGTVYSETFNDIDAGYTYIFTPTLYRSWSNETGQITHTFFSRSEAAYNTFRGRWFAVVSGYGQRYEMERLTHHISVSGSTNGPFYGVYFGYGLSINPIR